MEKTKKKPWKGYWARSREIIVNKKTFKKNQRRDVQDSWGKFRECYDEMREF